METSQPASAAPYASAQADRGMFGTKIPSSVAFVIGILLFLLPFSEIKCGGQTLMTQSGLGFALGKSWKFAGGLGQDMLKDLNTRTGGGKQEGNARYFIIGALAMGVIGFATTFGGSKSAGRFGMIAGVIGAGALIAFMFDLKKWFNDGLAKQAANKAGEGADSIGLDNIGDNLSNTSLGFTPWYYVAIVAFLAAAFFCYKRISSMKG